MALAQIEKGNAMKLYYLLVTQYTSNNRYWVFRLIWKHCDRKEMKLTQVSFKYMHERIYSLPVARANENFRSRCKIDVPCITLIPES